MFYYRAANYNYKCNRQETLPSPASLTLHSGGGGATVLNFITTNVSLSGFALVTHLCSVTSAMLHRYFWPFSVQHFSNLSLKGNTIEFCSCPISYSVLKIALRNWEYLPIEEIENFAWKGFFMWWWESGEQWFWPFKPFLKLKSNSVKISPVGVNVKLCREEIFFYRLVENWRGVILTIRTNLLSCLEICEGFLWIRHRDWKHGKYFL